MNDKPDIRFVDSHAECNGSHYDEYLVVHPVLLYFPLSIVVYTSVVIGSRYFLFVEHFRNLLAVFL
jgi:hypothetical protein